MTPDAFIFDLDGTLVDSLQDIADALNRALADHALKTAPTDCVRGWVGGGLRTLCMRACAAAGIDDSNVLNQVVQSAETHYQRCVVAHTRPYPNILQMLDLLKSRNARMAVLSNKPHNLTVEVVRRLQLDHYFTFVQGPESEAARKPAPHAALRIAGAFDRSPERVFMVGDSVVDIETAANAGMVSVAVTWGFRPREELIAARPKFLVETPLEIPKLV